VDRYLLEQIDRLTPDFNRTITNGLAVEHMMGKASDDDFTLSMIKYIDELVRINTDFFPEGFEYVGSAPCSPQEQFEEVTKEYKSKRKANIAQSDEFMIKLRFRYKGQDLYDKRIILPFVRPGGILWLNGALYNIAPVMADVGYSVAQGSLFVRFQRTKLTFRREDYHFFVNGKREISHVFWSLIHYQMKNVKSSQIDNRRKINSCLPHYFYCMSGVKKTFKEWLKVDVKVGYAKDFDSKKYPRERWVVYESLVLSGKHPTGDIVLMVKRDDDSEAVRRFVAGFFYVVDTFPSDFRHPQDVDNVELWQWLLGRLISGDFEHRGRALENVAVHLDSVSHMLDSLTRKELRDANVDVKDFWELLFKIMTDLAPHFFHRSSEEASMYNKRYTVLRYVLEELNAAINYFAFRFQSQRDKQWTLEELNKELNKHIKPKTAMRYLTRKHGEINTVAYPGDNKCFRITCMAVPQEKSKKSPNSDKGFITDPTKRLHASIAEVGQFNNQPKTHPDGRTRVNPYLRLKANGVVERRPELQELIDGVQELID
jgi:hypothetical protein